jgi:hypothetical protein
MELLLDTRNDLHISSSADILGGLDHTKDKVVSFKATAEATQVSCSNVKLDVTYLDSSTLALRAAMVGLFVVTTDGHIGS